MTSSTTVTLIHGDDSFLIERAIFAQKKTASVVDTLPSSAAISDVFQAMQSIGLFADNRLIIIPDWAVLSQSLSKSDSMALENGLKSCQDGPNRLLLYPVKSRIDKRKKAISLIQSYGRIELLSGFKDWEAPKRRQWIKNEVSTKNKTITSEALDALDLYSGHQLRVIAAEIEKLDIYTDTRTTITVEDVHELCPLAQASLFEFTDALNRADTPAILRHLKALLDNRVDPFYLFAVIVNSFRLYACIADGLQHGQSIDAIATDTKKHPFIVKKLAPLVKKNYPLSTCTAMYQRLAEMDIVIKTGQLDAGVALVVAITKLSDPAAT